MDDYNDFSHPETVTIQDVEEVQIFDQTLEVKVAPMSVVTVQVAI